MIRSKTDYFYYIEADRIARSLPKNTAWTLRNWLFPDCLWIFQKTLRKYEYYRNCKRGIVSKLVMIFVARKFKKLSYQLGFTIPINVFGPGLSIAHYGTIVINDAVRIGANCRIHTCVNIGTEVGYRDRAPKIGNNCYIGPGAKIFGDITIGDNIAIAANAVVNRSFPEGHIVIGGIPAKKISDKDVYDMIIPATELIAKGFNDRELSGIPAKELRQLLVKDDATGNGRSI